MKTLFQAGLLAAVLMCVSGLLVVPLWRRAHRASSDSHVESLGVMAAKGVRYTLVDNDATVLRAAADEMRLDRLPMGIFRVGFAQRLVLRNVTVEVVAQSKLSRSSPRQQDVESALPPSRQRALIGALQVHGLSLRLANPSGEWLEIRAQECVGSLLDRKRLVCRGGVRVTGAGINLAFAELKYDLRNRGFVGGRSTDPSGGPHALGMEAPALRALNAALDRIGTPDVEKLRLDSAWR